MATTMKGLLKGLRYITQIFDEEKEQEMQIGFPTDVKHVAHIGSDGPATNTPSWMNDFKPQEHEKAQVVSRGNSNKYNPQAMNQRGAGLKELLPPLSTNEKPKQKTRRKSANGSPPRRSNGNAASSDEPSKHSRHNRSKHGSMDSSSDQEPSVRRRRGGVSVPDMEVSSNHLPDGSAPPRKATSRPRKLKGSSVGGEASIKKSSKGKPENSVDNCNDII
ncbi:hypothetical protein EUTSA_v10017223mg [Eutrema salsugineum]|uniref:CRIB domain-containing protein n=1 Tax=Eutrema salsugineum TaxID=72664 RepID=V4MHA1_EUTSA|nr:CRIB domain-containing protein RIC1 [Eutrema salsugineum]ESQ51943.1 hypothetical protein EUTSA_v10017223mg [Eutrema salsugineum]